MRPQAVASPSQLPSLIMPCPTCTGRLVFRTVHATKPPSDLEDSIYACERCETQVIRTTFCRSGGSKSGGSKTTAAA